MKRFKGLLFFGVFNVVFSTVPLFTPTYAAEGTLEEGFVSTENDYRIGFEDVLEISVWRNQELSDTVTVRPDGMISLPLIADVQAAGRTPDQLRQAIVAKLKEYQETVVVSVIVNEVNSFRIYMLGEVVRPGTFSLRRKTTLIQAIALAGGFTQFASKNKIMVVREGGEGAQGEKILVRFDDIIKRQSSRMNVSLKPGDTVFVP